MPKQLIRKKILALRRQCDAGRCRELSCEIQKRFLQTESFIGASCVALYSPIHNEVGTEKVAAAVLSSGKTLVYPRVEHGGLVFVPMTDPDLLRPGSFDVPEPCHGQVIAPEEIDLFVVPGIAFDLVGHRLGYGRGFYDRALGQCPAKTVKVGFSYDFQVVDALPVRPHDQRLTVLITETRLLVFSR